MAERKTSRSEEFRQRFRTFFLRSGPNTSPTHTPPPSPAGIIPPALTDELLVEMGPNSTLTVMQRVELIQNARECICSKEPINSSTLGRFWTAVGDLLTPEEEATARDVAWGAMIDMLRHQPLKIGALVDVFGRCISEYIASTEQEVERKIVALNLLTDDGFSMNIFIDSVDVVLFQLMQESCKWDLADHYMKAADFVERSLRHGCQDLLSPEYRILMLKHVCTTTRSLSAAGKPTFSRDLGSCMRLVQALLEASEAPPISPSTNPLVAAVPPQRPNEAALSEILRLSCHLIGDKMLHQTAWDVSKRLLNDPSLCEAALEELCSIVSDSDDVLMVRGALFHAGMGLWSCEALPALSSAANTRLFLASLRISLDRSFDTTNAKRQLAGQEMILDEVMKSLARLLRKHPDFVCKGDQTEVAASWKIILEVLTHLVAVFTADKPSEWVQQEKSIKNLLAFLTTVENLYADKKIPNAFHTMLLEIFERCTRLRSDTSIMHWMTRRMEHIQASPESEQAAQVTKMLNLYFTTETNETVRIHTICLLINLVSRLPSLPQEVQFELLETAILPLVDSFPNIPEGSALRVKVIQLFIVCVDELDKVRPRDNQRRNELIVSFCSIMSKILSEGRIESAEVEAVVHEYIHIFMRTWQMNGVLGVCVRCFDQLCGLLKKFYFDSPISLKTLLTEEVKRIRELKLKLFTFFLDFRCSWNLVLDHESRSPHAPSLLFLEPPRPTAAPVDIDGQRDDTRRDLSFVWVMKMALHCLREERDWVVLRLVLEKLSLQFEHWFIVKHYPDIVAKMSASLCDMIRNRSLCMPAKLYDGPRLQQFHVHVLAPISRLVSFSHVMDKNRQRQLLDCLYFGLVSTYNRECIGTLTLALLEMPEAIRALLPAIVLKLSQIASNPDMSAYVLEFLSMLVYLPGLYADFVEEQYLSIFAIAVPYTNPFRFNNYIVATAYRLISAWYIKCHQPFRKAFSTFINKGLKSHVMRNFEEHEKAEARRTGLSSADPSTGGCASLESSTSEPRRSRGRTMHSIGLGLRKSNRTKLPTRRSHSPGSVTSHGLDVSATLPIVRRPNILGSPPMPRKSCSVSVAPSATVAERLHRELTQVCADMLARFAFSSIATMPKRSEVAERLLNGGPRRSWLVGPAQVVTITTSMDCPPGSNGLCSRCADIFGSKEEEIPRCQRSHSQPPAPPFLSCAPRDACSRPAFDPPEGNICWCSGWTEVTIHRPSGITSWIARLQNPQSSVEAAAAVGGRSDASALPLQIAHLYKRAHRSTGEQPVAMERLRESQYQALHRQQFGELAFAAAGGTVGPGGDGGGERPSGTMAIPGRRSGLGPRARVMGGSAESLSPQEAAAELGRSPSLPELALTPEEEQKEEKEEEEGRREETENGEGERPNSRGRSSTVQSVPNEQGRIRGSSAAVATAARKGSTPRNSYGLNPSFVFLQLYYSHAFGNVEKDILRPVPLSESDHIISFSLSQLSEIPVYETHSVGVIYVSPGQANDESAIFANQSGSQRYNEFLSRLGQAVCLSRCDTRRQYVGDLDTKRGEDGLWTVVWNEEILQLAFHVTTLMPPATSHASKQNKKRHVGNDYVTVVYNDSGEEYKLGTITGQFQFVNIVVEPLPDGYNRVVFITRDNGVSELLGALHARIVSDAGLGRFIRVSALHANLASLILTRQRLDPASPFTNCWLERLRRLQRLRALAFRHQSSAGGGGGGGGGDGGDKGAIENVAMRSSEICEDFADIVH